MYCNNIYKQQILLHSKAVFHYFNFKPKIQYIFIKHYIVP